MGTDISPIALELLYSPGFFLVKDDLHKVDKPAETTTQVSTGSSETNITEHPQQVSVPAPANLIFMLTVPEQLSSAEQQMLERMASYIRTELSLGKEWLTGGHDLWQNAEGVHHWVCFGTQPIMPELQTFAFGEHERGSILQLPDVGILAPNPALKKQALEALRTWAASIQ
jgi:hypothetical protein